MNEVTLVQGPIARLRGEFVLYITLTSECSGLSRSSEFSECIRVVIPDRIAKTLCLEAGDMVCMHGADGVFRLQRLKAGLV